MPSPGVCHELRFLPGAMADIANQTKSSFPRRLDCRELRQPVLLMGRLKQALELESLCHLESSAFLDTWEVLKSQTRLWLLNRSTAGKVVATAGGSRPETPPGL